MTKINPFGKLRVNGEQCRTIKKILEKIITQIKALFAGIKKGPAKA